MGNVFALKFTGELGNEATFETLQEALIISAINIIK